MKVEEAKEKLKKMQNIVQKRTGHWISHYYFTTALGERLEDYKECSYCHAKFASFRGSKYCPNCGAKMEGKEK